VNKPGIMNSPCFLDLANASPWAVRLLHTSRDDASVYELIGAGTAHPDLIDLGANRNQVQSRSGDAAVVTLDWGTPSVVSQVSLGEAALATGSTASTTLEIRTPTGGWVPVARANSRVGDGNGAAPFLLASLPPGTAATAARVVLTGPDAGSQSAVVAAWVSDFHVLGQTAGGAT
jgi:hypothetical protein